MLLNSRRALKSALFCLILTSLGTGCVKNNNKDGSAQISDQITLDQKSLLTTSTSDGDTQSINVSSATAHKNIIQEWVFDLVQDSDVEINYVRYGHEKCTGSDSFIYKFEVQENKKDQNGKLTTKSIPMLTKGYKLGLLKGNYILRAILNNNAECKDIKFSFKVKIEKSPILSYNSNIKAQYTCDTVEFKRASDHRKELVPNEHAKINTSPMKVQRIANNLYSYVNVLNIDEHSICEAPKGKNVHSCQESILVQSDIENAKLVSQQRCKIKNESRKTKASTLALFEKNGNTDIDFTCSYSSQRRNYSFSNCRTDYNLGEKLPIKISNGHPIFALNIQKRSLNIDFEFNPSNIDMAILPGQIYVNLYNIKTEENVLKFTTQMSKDKLIDGNFVLESAAGEIGIRKKLRHHNMRDLHIVISRTPNDYTKGIFHLPLKNICNRHPGLISRSSKNGSTLRGCDL